MAAFNDPQKLADAIALARGFKTGQFNEKRNHKNRARMEAIDFAPSHGAERITDRQPCNFTWHIQRERIAERNRQYDAAGFVQPSQRQYSNDALDKGWQIRQLRAEDEVIGKAVFDFLNRNDKAPTPAASPKPSVSLPATSQAIANFAGLRSPILAGASTPLTPESLIQEPRDNHISPADTLQKPDDEQEADQLVDLLRSFSFKERSSTENGSGQNIMDRFLELLAGNAELSEHLDLEKQLCVKNRHTTTADSDVEHEEKTNLEVTAVPQHHQSNKADQPVFINANIVPATTKGKRLCPKAPVFTPAEAGSANDDIGCPPSKEIAVPENDQHQKEKLPFTGQFSSPFDDTPHGHWPATEKATPALPLTYAIWVPVQYPIPNTYSESTVAMNETQVATPNSGGHQSQLLQGLSASRWAQKPPKQS